jgi:glycosyltransferase involved in cell wall biosynthesis
MMGGTPHQVEEYRRAASNLGLDGHSILTAAIGQRDVREYLQRSDVLVSPRQTGTNTPLKIYEQLAMGIPLVATRVLAHTQVLDDRVSLLVDPTPEALSAGIRKVLADPEASRAMSRRARAFYEERYGWVAYSRRIGEVLTLVREAGSTPQVEARKLGF